MATKSKGASNGVHAPATPATPATPAEEFRFVSPDAILPSETNPRKTFTDLEGLAESVKAKGVMEPLLVRLAPGFALVPGRESGKDGFFWESSRRQLLFGFGVTQDEVKANPPLELIAGERRLRAAKLAGARTVPVRVMNYDDTDVLEAQVVENEQRQDVAPLEKAEGYRQLLRHRTVEDLAAKVGKSVSTVRGLLKLLDLPPVAAEAVASGRLPSATAQLIGRVPGAEAREQLARRVLAENVSYGVNVSDADLARAEKEDAAPLSYRETKELIVREFSVELKGCPFSQTDKKLLPGAGSCKDCRKRVGNLKAEDPDGYEGMREDVCTDPACYREKVTALRLKELTRLKAGSSRVLDLAECDRIIGTHGGVGYPWLDLETPAGPPTVPDFSGKTYVELLGKKRLVKLATWAVDRQGKARQLARREDVEAALRKPAKAAADAAADDTDEDDGCDPAAGRLAGESWELRRKALDLALLGAMKEVDRRMQMVNCGPPAVKVLEWACAAMLRDALFQEPQIVYAMAEWRKIELPEDDEGEDELVMEPWLAWIGRASSPDLLTLLVEFQARFVREDGLEDLLQLAGLNWQQCMDQARKAEESPGADAAEQPSPVEATGVCRVCGCSDNDCRSCVERTGEPCAWADDGRTLCTACAPLLDARLGNVPGVPTDAATVRGLREAGLTTVGQVYAMLARGDDAVVIALSYTPPALAVAQAKQLIVAVRAWLKDQLARDTEGNELMPEEAPAAPPKGEPIEPLGLDARELNAASIAGHWDGRPAKKAVGVKAITLNGRPYAVAGGVHGPDGDCWDLLPLYTPLAFAARFPGRETHLKPAHPSNDEERRNYYFGVRVDAGALKRHEAGYPGRVEMVIGPKAEQRRLVDLRPLKERRKS